jgi:peptidoglycan-N-acetylglucosamine deacetylase
MPKAGARFWKSASRGFRDAEDLVKFGVVGSALKVKEAMTSLRTLGLALLLASGSAASASAQDRSLINACWSPSALAGVAGENIPHKGDHRFDTPPAAMELAPFPPLVPEDGVIRGVKLKDGRKLIALTFDLCEQPGEVAGYDGAIIDYLRRDNVKATFFAGGKWLRSHEERAQQLLADPLFEIGSHSEAHRNFRRLYGERLTGEILGPQRAYETIRAKLMQSQCVRQDPSGGTTVAPRITLFRFPYGVCDAQSLRAVHEQGLRAIQWDLATGDPTPTATAAGIVHTMTARAHPGAIILNHANGRGWHTAEALPFAIDKLRKMGYEFVTVSELIDAGEPVVAQSCYDVRPGDTDRNDVFAARRHMPEFKTTVHQ